MDENWDNFLNHLMDIDQYVSSDLYTAILKDEKGLEWEVWIANHPFSSGKLWSDPNKKTINRCPASIKTRIRLEDYINSKLKVKESPIKFSTIKNKFNIL